MKIHYVAYSGLMPEFLRRKNRFGHINEGEVIVAKIAFQNFHIEPGMITFKGRYIFRYDFLQSFACMVLSLVVRVYQLHLKLALR